VGAPPPGSPASDGAAALWLWLPLSTAELGPLAAALPPGSAPPALLAAFTLPPAAPARPLRPKLVFTVRSLSHSSLSYATGIHTIG
jgi:hypothetical protein